jgi:hypothetical protein
MTLNIRTIKNTKNLSKKRRRKANSLLKEEIKELGKWKNNTKQNCEKKKKQNNSN